MFRVLFPYTEGQTKDTAINYSAQDTALDENTFNFLATDVKAKAHSLPGHSQGS